MTRTEEYPLNGISQTSEIRRAIEMTLHSIDFRMEWEEELRLGKMFGVLIAEDAEGKRHTLRAYSGQILGRSDWEGYVPAIYDYLEEGGYFKTHEAEISRLNELIKAKEALLPKGKRTAEVEALKRERKEKSQELQRWLFSKFILKGADGTEKSVLEVFQEYAKANSLKQILPPAGTGECCAPKLLHYANVHSLKPLQLVEFWYGASGGDSLRHHGALYEPCQAKCKPILWFLTPKEGLEILGGRPTLRHTPAITREDLIYEDEWLVAITKPPHLLSVPGKRQLPNAEDQLKELLGYSFLKMVHRLDMDTSGVLIAAKSSEAHTAMQRIFASHHGVEKCYSAVLVPPKDSPCVTLANEKDNDSSLKYSQLEREGTISLPLSGDFLNRPRQRVDYENGKPAETIYSIHHPRADGYLPVALRTLTGRTHQLRVHCAHPDGLGMPILGDPLYGNTPFWRMCLHATAVTFHHPFTHKRVEINAFPNKMVVSPLD